MEISKLQKWLRNSLGGIFFLSFGLWYVLTPYRGTKAFIWLIGFRFLIVAILFIIRLPAKKQSGYLDQGVAFISTFLPAAYSTRSETYFFSQTVLYNSYYLWVFLVGGNILSILGYLSLGRSFGI